MTDKEYKSNEIQKIKHDMEVHEVTHRHVGLKITGWTTNTKTMNISYDQLEKIRKVLTGDL